MASAFSHPAPVLALASVFPRSSISTAVLAAGIGCSILPDLDVIGFRFGIEYGDLLGHRGLTHSLAFAAGLAGVLTWPLTRGRTKQSYALVWIFLFLSTASHPFLDALTDGGLGVAWWAPFSTERYFFPFRPIAVSPIGVGRFFSTQGAAVLISELAWVWLPSALVIAVVRYIRKTRSG